MKKEMFYGANKVIFENAKALRNNLTAEEPILWTTLKQCFRDYKFRRQHPISNYIADFYCHKLKLVIEVDGSIHYRKRNITEDKLRQEHLEHLGITVLRFTNEQVRNGIETVVEKISDFIKNRLLQLKQIFPFRG
jgi:cyclase